MRQMKFDIPDDVAERFTSEVAADEQTRIVLRAIRSRIKPRLTEEQWAEVCTAANDDPETQQVQADFNAIPDTFNEVWDDAPTR